MLCMEGTLDLEKVKGKILACLRGKMQEWTKANKQLLLVVHAYFLNPNLNGPPLTIWA
jgi:hypothetical protein